MKTVAALTYFPPGLLPLISSFIGADSILVAGGNDQNAITVASAMCYSLETSTWRTDVPSMSIPRWGSTTVAIGGRMMVFGGRDDKCVCLATCEAFDLVTKAWTALPSMSVSRFGACGVAFQGRAFIFGGYDAVRGMTTSAECFDSTLNRWSAIAPMPTMRFRAVAVALAGRGVIVMGGIDTKDVTMQSADLYDPTTNQWEAMTWQLPKPLSRLVAYCVDSVLYVGSTINEWWSLDLSAVAPVWLSLSSQLTATAIDGLALAVDSPIFLNSFPLF